MQARPRQTLPSWRRIRQRSEFERVFHAKCLTNKWFAIYVQENQGGFARLGLVVSKRIIPKAVNRNIAKRLIREAFRCCFSTNRALDVVVRARRQLSPETSKEGRLALAQLFQAVQM